MIFAGVTEAKAHWAHLLEQVAQGEHVTITKHGVPVARLVPAFAPQPMSRDAAIARLRELSQSVTLDGVSLKDMIREGRRNSV